MRLFLKILTLIGGIVTAVAALTILPATRQYLIHPSHELVAITPLMLQILLIGLASLAGLEAILLGLLASLEANLRRERTLLASVFAGITLGSLILMTRLKPPLG